MYIVAIRGVYYLRIPEKTLTVKSRTRKKKKNLVLIAVLVLKFEGL